MPVIIRNSDAKCAAAPRRLMRRSVAAGANLIAQALAAIAEARMQRTAIKVELYCGRYKHASKNDDDLPIVRFPVIR